MREFKFSMALPADRTQSIYQGQARYIIVESDQGLKLQLPAVNFRRYVTDDGINGRFAGRIDSDNRIVDLRRL